MIGIFGLAAAKTFHQLEPQRSLAILDSGTTVGGVWAEERLYPGLKTNNMLGTFEYPDFPMRTDTFGVKPGEHMPGEVMFKYLTQYAEKFGIFDKIRFQSAVSVAEHQDTPEGGWILTVQNGAAQSRIFARKLVMAGGLTSEPFLPHIEGQEKFGVPIFHSRDFTKYAGTLDSAKTVTIFGGTKSAWDVAYAYASKGVKVNWVIRGGSSPGVWYSVRSSHVCLLQQAAMAQFGYRLLTLRRLRNGSRNWSVSTIVTVFRTSGFDSPLTVPYRHTPTYVVQSLHMG